jgi:probable lipoprotein NlpC
MQKIPFLSILCLLFLGTSCGILNKNRNTESGKYNSKTISTVVKTARTYIGTPYKYGGMDEDGLDCSGLVMLSFKSARLNLPRVSTDMATVGHEVKIREVRVGDLVFFITDKGTRINHVGIVTERKSPDNILFIHSASNGVREDNLFSKYYQSTFVKATRPF